MGFTFEHHKEQPAQNPAHNLLILFGANKAASRGSLNADASAGPTKASTTAATVPLLSSLFATSSRGHASPAKMGFDFESLEPKIREILSSPGTDLTTISAKRVRRQLTERDPSITEEFTRENKKEIDVIIARVYGEVNNEAKGDDVDSAGPSESRKRKKEGEDDEGEDEAEGDNVEENEEDDTPPPPPKKPKKSSKKEQDADAEVARQLSNEINGRSSRRNTGKAAKKGGRSKKSAATVDSDDDSDGEGGKKKKRGGAKGGFAKEYTLSEPLAVVLQTEKLSRPQVVKQLWDYIKSNGLQNPSNKKEIMCDANLKAVFGTDKIDMFKMNKFLGQ
ncbi:hypothetical protein AX16_003992 [Volvariella volvacea WC 439]|nr:hypothetical protein AX16_003992 [Volvariella volvacea WC 439]